MNFRIATCSLAVAAAFAGIAPLTAAAAPSVAFRTPASGSTISGNIYQSSACEVSGANIDRVRFYLDSTALNIEENAPWNCNIDTRKFSDGTHTLRAVAYDSAGVSASTQISVNIKNSTAATTTTTPASGPTVSWKAPTEGATLKGTISLGTSCEVSGSGISKVIFHLDGTQLNTELSSPWQCTFDTRKFADGAHTLKATAYNSSGASAAVTRSVTIQNGTSTPTTPTNTPPSVSFRAPLSGATLAGSLSGSACEALASDANGIQQVQFYMDSTLLNTELSSPWNCSLDTRKFADGAHTLKAVATDKLGAASTAQIGITVKNSTTSTPTAGAPTVSFKAPASGATLSGSITQSAACEVTGSNIAKVQFSLDSAALNTELTAPWNCNLDTTKFANGTHTLMATAYNSSGAAASSQIAVNIKNGTTTTPTTPTTPTASPIDPADIKGWASADLLFAQQSGYNTQVIGQYINAELIPESGIHGTVLSNGESLRLGKETDPANSARKALTFQVSPSDPNTSGAKRSELKFPNGHVELNKVYWTAFSMYVRDWGTLATTDHALFGLQVHGGCCGLSPSVAVYSRGGKTFYVDARTSPSNPGSQSTSYSVRSAEYPMPFGRWVDMVFKFKLDPAGGGFLQVWMDGTQIMNHSGPLGYYDDGTTKPYFKFGYYNWTSFSSARKVMLRSPMYLIDPTGSKYKPEDLRAHINAQP